MLPNSTVRAISRCLLGEHPPQFARQHTPLRRCTTGRRLIHVPLTTSTRLSKHTTRRRSLRKSCEKSAKPSGGSSDYVDPDDKAEIILHEVKFLRYDVARLRGRFDRLLWLVAGCVLLILLALLN